MTGVKILLAIWGMSITASWFMYRGEAFTRADRMLLASAAAMGLAAVCLAVML